MAFTFSKADRANLLKWLGGGAEAARYLDAVESYISPQRKLISISGPTLAEQKAELKSISDKASELFSLLSNMSLDAALILRIAFAEVNAPDAKRNRLPCESDDFFLDPLSFPDDEVLSVFITQLEVWSKIASYQMTSIKTGKGARRKTARDIFVRQLVHQYHNTFGRWPERGEGELFHSVIARLCGIAGYHDKADIEKVIRAAKKYPPFPAFRSKRK